MAQIQNAQYFPYFIPLPPHSISPPPNFPSPRNPPSPPKVTLPPPSPPRSLSPPPPPKLPLPPPPSLKPPPPHTFSPPPPPHPISPPPPAHPIAPPPPHAAPTPSPPPHHSTVIIFVFISIGGVFFLAFLAVALFCLIKNRKKKILEETERVKMDEHVRIHEDIVAGPHGTQTVVLTIDEDLHTEEEIHTTQLKSSAPHHHDHGDN